MPARPLTAALTAVLVLGAAAPAAALPGGPRTAALQVALRAKGLYGGDVDGLRGPATRGAVLRFQRRAGLVADGVAGPATRRALGRRGGPSLGTRPLRIGAAGWDVAGMQFLLARRGFPSGSIDGGFGARTARALVRFQRWVGLGADGVMGPATLRALRRPSPRSPIRLIRPVATPVGDRFRFRGARLHAGVDFPAPYGARVAAAGRGRVVRVGYDGFGWGRYVVIAHPGRTRSLYAHLSAVTVGRGRWVTAGTRIGSVGATGAATGPHLHFEVFVRGANVDPLTATG